MISDLKDRGGAMMVAAVIHALTFAAPICSAEVLPLHAISFLHRYCADCHTGQKPEGEVRFDLQPIKWESSPSIEFWERVYDVLSQQEMPPSDVEQPAAVERAKMVQWLRDQLTKHAKPGGTTIRRLNREEYENSIRDLFVMPDFRTPDAFPADDSRDGFDNIGEGLVLSPPLMAQYMELATQIADHVLPPNNGSEIASPQLYRIGATGLAESALTTVEGDRFRIASSKKENANTAGWPIRFTAPKSGVYRLEIDASTFQTDKMFYSRQEKPFRLSVYAKPKTQQTYDSFESIRKLADFDVRADQELPQSFHCEIELNEGEAFGLRWVNGPIDSNGFHRDRLRQDRRLHAAMLAIGKNPRGMSQEQYYKEAVSLSESDLDLDDPRLNEALENRGFGGIGQPNGPPLMVNWFVHEEIRRYGPALDITDVSIEGPLRLIEDEEMRARKNRTARFLGERAEGTTDREYAGIVLRKFLRRAFRRSVSAAQVQAYVDLVIGETELANARVEDGLHVALRRALVSPNFLYRSSRQGRLDDYDLASRLSYFLTSSPPDDQLFKLADLGELSDPEILKSETLRLLSSDRSGNFVKSFTGQWLGTRRLHDIMPDPRLFFYYEQHRVAMTREVEMLFEEVLKANQSIDTLIDPGFSYRHRSLNKIYGDDLVGDQMQRVEFQRGGRNGGILGLSAVMMATANGVDTHPVQRGVWLLENVFGTPTPEPPNNVPAIAPDTTGTTTMRSLVQKHRADQSCARCHDKIDPLGMLLENFDPVGRWRDNYPIYVQPGDGEALKKEFYSNTGKGTKAGPPIDSVGVLTDGTRLEDVTELKRYLVKNIDIFSRCLTGKLMVYATGRPISFAGRRVVDQIVNDVKGKGNGFRDLIVAIVQSEAFALK